MKRKLVTSLFAGMLLLGIGMAGISCSSSNDKVAETQWKVVNVTVRAQDWVLVESEKETYYHATANLPELTQFVFDEGAALAYYKFNNNLKTALPFVKTVVGNDGVPYTETYSCDFELGNPSKVTFTLEASDAQKYDGLPPAANFQVVLIW